MLPPIGSMSALSGQGRFGVVVSAQPIGAPADGRQLVSLTIKDDSGLQTSKASAGRSGDARLSGDGSLQLQAPRAASSSNAARLPSELSASEKSAVARLQQRDQQVRQEEKAHAAVAGDLAGPISYTYQLGPDGRQYAVGGSVGIKASVTSGDPADAARKAGRIAAAANAATNPSAQDYAAARQAYALGSQLAEPSPPDRENGLRLQL